MSLRSVTSRPARCSGAARDTAVAAELWDASTRLTHVSWDSPTERAGAAVTA